MNNNTINETHKYKLYLVGVFVSSFTSSIPLFIMNYAEFGVSLMSLSVISLSMLLFSPMIKKSLEGRHYAI